MHGEEQETVPMVAPPIELEGSPELRLPPYGPRRSSSRAAVRLTGVNTVVLIAGLVTGPITARALGVDGRGDLAAIVAVLTLGPWLLDLGQSFWIARERARGISREELLGAALPVAFACSLIGVAAAIPLSHALGHGRPVVTTFLEVGLVLMPVNVMLQTLFGVAIGESLWRLIAAYRIAGSVVPALAIIVLALLGRLNVATAAAAYLVGTLGAALLLLQTVRGMGRPLLDRGRLAAASRFGVKSWLSTVSATANNRLDQVLMAGLSSSHQLGLYAVAVTVASLMSGLVGAVSIALYPRVAEGDGGLAARSSRVTMALTALVAAMLAVASPWLVPFVFGQAFQGAVPMVIILLVASVPMAGAFVLSAALNAANNPGATMRAELAALAFTIPGLVVFVRQYGGLLAAVVSLIAYTIRLGMQLGPACTTFAIGYRALLVPTRTDLIWFTDRMRRLAAR